MKSIAVLITCYNRRRKTVICLQNLYQCALPPGHTLSVFLVDDSSTDGTSAAVKEKFQDVNLIQGNGSLYWNRGMHKAWQVAKSTNDFDYYLWLNDDTMLMPYALTEMLDCAEAKDNKAIVCGAICSATTKLFTYGGRTKKGEVILPGNELPYCELINGNCVLVSKTVCDAVGILDPVYPHAIGDHEYGLRALKNGFQSITTRSFIGYCEKNDLLPLWQYSNVPLKRRLKVLYSPLGNSHPYYFFIYERKYYGIPTAVKHFFTIHLRVLIPALWKQ